MKKTYLDLKREYNILHKQSLETASERKAMKQFLTQLKASSKNEFSQISRAEIKQYDIEWINFLEKAVSAISAIVENPKRNLKTARYIVPVELAKKINAESVIHLSQHSQYVKDIDKNGDVIPSKILTVEAEDDYGIYENRFIRTLIDKLILFCHKRYEFMKDHAVTKDYDILEMKSTVVIDGVTFEYTGKVKISQPSNDEGKREYNEQLFQRITTLVERVNFFKTTPFYQQVKDTRPVKNPILQTNIILKNQNYKACYEVWKFLDRYDQLGIRIKVKEQQGKFDEAYLDQLYMNILMSEMTMNVDRYHKVAIPNRKKQAIAPKLNKKIIDPALDNTRFDLALVYGRDQMTKAQLAALKRKEAKEKERLKREALRLKKKELDRIRKEKEKEKRRLALEKRKQKEKERRLREEERQRLLRIERMKKQKEKERIRKQLELERKRLLDEQEKLRRTRITVKRIAVGKDQKLASANIVTEEMIKKDEDFQTTTIKPKEKNYGADLEEVKTPIEETLVENAELEVNPQELLKDLDKDQVLEDVLLEEKNQDRLDVQVDMIDQDASTLTEEEILPKDNDVEIEENLDTPPSEDTLNEDLEENLNQDDVEVDVPLDKEEKLEEDTLEDDLLDENKD